MKYCLILSLFLFTHPFAGDKTETNITDDLKSKSHSVRKSAHKKLQKLSDPELRALIKKIEQSKDPELRSHIHSLNKMLNTFEPLASHHHEMMNMAFSSFSTDMKKKSVDFQIIEHRKHGIIELGSTRVVFINSPLEDYSFGDINVIAKENSSSKDSYKSEKMKFFCQSDEKGTSISINDDIKFHINSRILKIHKKEFNLDSKEKVIFVDNGKKTVKMFLRESK